MKLTIKDETPDGEESRCLRSFKLTPSGLLMGGREFNHQEAAARVDARLEYTIEDQILTVRDKKHSKELFWMKLEDILEDREQFVCRMNFEYELMFKFDSETLEIFDVQKNGDNQVEL